jgi:probable selenium-dependent hydroxylase accessory protein YqeC
MNLIKTFDIQNNDVITITGGGGKTSLMFAIGNELSARHQLHLITTTAKICIADVPPEKCLVRPNIEAIITEITKDRQKEWVIGSELLASQKISGFSDAALISLQQALSPLVILNEGDGSNRRPYKFYADHEPVIPGLTTKIIHVIGAEVLSQPIDEHLFHRSQLYKGSEQIFDEAVLKETLKAFKKNKLDPEFSSLPQILYINKADDHLENAKRMAEIGQTVFPACCYGSLQAGWIKAV